MKKLLISAVSILLFSLSSSAQIFVNAGYGFGEYNVKVSDIITSHPLNGIYAGATYNFDIIGDLGVEAGLNYTCHFYNDQFSSSPKSFNKYIYNGLNIPVAANYAFGINSDLKLKFFLGPDFNIGLSSKETTTIAGNALPTIDHFENGSDARFYLDLTAGAALETSIGVRLKFGYLFNLTDLDTTDSSRTNHYMFVITAGYAF